MSRYDMDLVAGFRGGESAGVEELGLGFFELRCELVGAVGEAGAGIAGQDYELWLVNADLLQDVEGMYRHDEREKERSAVNVGCRCCAVDLRRRLNCWKLFLRGAARWGPCD